jgi:hypothetical protein
MQPITNLPNRPDSFPNVEKGIEAINKATTSIEAFPGRFGKECELRSQTAIFELCGGLLVVGLLIAAFAKRPAK